MASDDQENQSASSAAAKEERKKRRKRRWGDASEATTAAPAATAPAVPPPPPPPAAATSAALDAKKKALALQGSIRAKLAALKASKQGATSASSSSSTTTAAASVPAKRPADTAETAEKASKRAKHFDIDFTVTAPTFQKEKDEVAATLKPKKKVNPYLSTTTAAAADDQEDADVDERLVRASKPRARHKVMSFVEPGTFVEIAERKRQKAVNAAESGFVSGRKTGQYVAQSNMAQVYGGGGGGAAGAMEEKTSFTDPRLLPERAEHRYDHMPLVMEWWDTELLPSKLKKAVAHHEGQALSQQAQAQLNQLGGTSAVSSTTTSKEDGEDGADDKKQAAKADEAQLQELRSACFDQASLSYSKTAALIQHIVPMKPPHVAKNEVAKKPVLHLTKREMKRQRKLRRQEKQRELQDRQAAGLEEPPEPRLTLKNFIRVLGDQAYLDPSQMEQKVMEQIQARQRAHLDRNQATKLTKEQRAAKKTHKLEQDASQGVTKVALFFVQDMSHPYHRAKVDLNAQQNMITGGVLECESPSMACVIVEGGPKAIQRYKRLMLVRMKWTGSEEDEEDDDEEEVAEDGDDAVKTHKFNKNNRCELVWEGLAVKRLFPNFVFQSCETAAQARKVLKAKGVEHYWDQVMEHANGARQGFQLKLVDSDDDDDDGNNDDTENVKVEAMDES